MIFVKLVFSPTAESFGVSAQIVPDGPEVRFHERSTRVPPGSNEGMSPFVLGSWIVFRACLLVWLMILVKWEFLAELLISFLCGVAAFFLRSWIFVRA